MSAVPIFTRTHMWVFRVHHSSDRVGVTSAIRIYLGSGYLVVSSPTRKKKKGAHQKKTINATISRPSFPSLKLNDISTRASNTFLHPIH